jgi:O-acetyl-ADP-ribose deacetylase (regulator of RNase III)
MTAARMEVVLGDISRLALDAIVNAANPTLLGGGGVDGAIHRAAGPELAAACRKLGGCAVGQAKLTPGFRLHARHVIHAVGPVWEGGRMHETTLLADCYRNSLALAARHSLRSVAFPAISTGAYRFPPDRAAEIAVDTVHDVLETDASFERVVFCCFDQASADRHLDALERVGE